MELIYSSQPAETTTQTQKTDPKFRSWRARVAPSAKTPDNGKSTGQF